MNKKALLVSIICCIWSIANADDVDISGKYISREGHVIFIIHESGSQYKIEAEEPNHKWKGVGFYNASCNCIRSVFQYVNSEKYGENVGFHQFDLSQDGNTIIKQGGWNDLKQFGVGHFSRKQ